MHQDAFGNTDVTTELVSSALAEERVEAARALFRRTLSSWVSDLLLLRQAGLLETRWTSHAPGDEIRNAA